MDVEKIGKLIRAERKAQGLTQGELAMTAHTASRFISDIENGKATCQIGKTLQVMSCLGIRIKLDASNGKAGG